MVAVAEPQLRGREAYEAKWDADAPGSGVARLEAVVHPRRLEQRAAQLEADVERIARRLEALSGEIARPFEHDSTLRDLRERHGRIVGCMRAREEAVLPEQTASRPDVNASVEIERAADSARSDSRSG